MKKNFLIGVLMIIIILIAGCSTTQTPTKGIDSNQQTIEKEEPTKQQFNAIDLVKEKIPLDMKNKVWYSEEWKQEKIGDDEWEVTVSDVVWKVSTKNIFCSQTGNMVSICSDNGLAKTYSDIEDYCKPDYICNQND